MYLVVFKKIEITGLNVMPSEGCVQTESLKAEGTQRTPKPFLCLILRALGECAYEIQ